MFILVGLLVGFIRWGNLYILGLVFGRFGLVGKFLYTWFSMFSLHDLIWFDFVL